MGIKRGFLQPLLIFSISIIWGCSSETKMPEIIELSYTNHFPPTHIQSKLAEAWSKEL